MGNKMAMQEDVGSDGHIANSGSVVTYVLYLLSRLYVI
jgi:hypothetical protein